MESQELKDGMVAQTLKYYKGAKVLQPLECPYYILDSVIEKSMELLAEYDVDLEGLKMAEELKSHVEKLYSNYWHVIIG